MNTDYTNDALDEAMSKQRDVGHLASAYIHPTYDRLHVDTEQHPHGGDTEEAAEVVIGVNALC